MFLQGKDATNRCCCCKPVSECIVLPCTWADVDATCKHEGKTALMHAVVHGHLNIVETLLNNGSNVHAISKNGSSVMELAVEAAKQTCPTHDEHVQWCTDASKCTFHKGRAEIVNLIENIL